MGKIDLIFRDKGPGFTSTSPHKSKSSEKHKHTWDNLIDKLSNMQAVFSVANCGKKMFIS